MLGTKEETTNLIQPDDTAASDEALLARARRGDREAFGKLIWRYRGVCLKRAMPIVRNLSDAEDEVQTASGKAFQWLDQYRGSGSFASWLSRIVENQCLMRIRRERNAHFTYLDAATDSNIRLELVGHETSPEDDFGREEVALMLRREMSRMPPIFRDVMMLHDSQQLPLPEVAERLGVSVTAAKSRLARARQELRLRIEKHCGRKGAATLLETAVYSETAYARAS